MEKNCRNCGWLFDIRSEKTGTCWRLVPIIDDLGPAEEIVRLSGFCRFWKPMNDRQREYREGRTA